VNRDNVDKIASSIQKQGGAREYAEATLSPMVTELAKLDAFHQISGPNCVLRGTADYPFRGSQSFFEHVHRLDENSPLVMDSTFLSTTFGVPFLPDSGANMRGCRARAACGLIVVHLGEKGHAHAGRDIHEMSGMQMEKEVLFLPFAPFRIRTARRVGPTDPPISCGDTRQQVAGTYDWVVELQAELVEPAALVQQNEYFMTTLLLPLMEKIYDVFEDKQEQPGGDAWLEDAVKKCNEGLNERLDVITEEFFPDIPTGG